MDDVLFGVEGGVGVVTLNRPKAINALSHGMIRAIDATLAEWAGLASVRLVLLEGAGERGFCAGGDIRALYEDAKAGRMAGPTAFFYDEYRLNARIAGYTKPVVALMDGIVMGGGIGLSAHASHRVVTQRSALAMPEVGIGFVPDVGGTWLLARAPGELGTHAALTAGRLGAADAILCGLADFCVASEELPALRAAIVLGGDTAALAEALRTHATAPPPGVLEAARPWIDACYAGDSVEAIVSRLEARRETEALAAAREIMTKSPSSLKVALHALRLARRHGRVEESLQQEFRAALACMRTHDFVEGVRAAVVDKDRNPAWSPALLRDVTEGRVAGYFAVSAETDLHLGAQ